MKRLLINIFLLALSLSSFAEGDVVLFYLNDGSFKGFYKEEIDSIVYSHYDTDSIWHSNVVVQDVWSNDSVCRIPVNKIDSICYSIPDPVYKPQVIRLDERYMPYISSVDGLGMKISPNIPDYLRPKPGDVLLYEGSNDVFPDGFSGKVSEFSGETLECESVTIEDVYDEVVFMGRYALAQENTGSGAKYHAKSVMRKNMLDDVIDYIDGTLDYIEDVSVGDFSGSPEIPNIKMGIKVKFGDVTAAYSEKLKTTMFVEFRYSANPYYPILYSKLTTKVTTEQTAKIQYSKKILDLDPETDEVFKGHEVEWFSFSVPKDEKTGKTTDQIIIINKNVPVPQFPLFSLGIRFGVFQEAKLEGELSYTFKGTSTNEYTSIYSLDKRNMFELTPGELVTSKISPEPTYEHIFEGDVKGSIWAGAIFGVTAGFGGELKDDKYLSATVKEDLNIKIGPYAEIDANLKISDGIIDKSWYSALHDTKVKLGVKAGVNLSLTAKGFGCSATWDQLSLEPQKLLWEKNCYLFPDFTKPTYKRSGNSLTCTSKLTRSCVPNHVGFRLYDENGICQTKYQEAFYSVDTGQEFAIGETFTGLDFEKHRYRIVPITALFAVIPLEIPAPKQTDALCPDSNHPHLIDMGLPSGTEWQCSNLYADEPTDGGGYYQWGAPYKSTSYTSSYVMPSYSGSSYQGSANDAATANLGSEYATPTKAQFEELWSSCTHTIHKSNWGYENYGMYLKSKSGADLYLPFAGYMQGTSPVDANVGYYVVSDNSVDKGATKCPVYVIDETIHQCSPASWYGYSVRPISGGKQSTDCSLQLSSATIDFGTVSVGASTTKTIVLTNTGNAAATVRIDDEYDDISFNMGSGGVTIAPGQQFTLEVTYTPSSVPSACPVLKLVSDGFEGGYALIYTDAKVSGSAPDTGTHEYVDLGLPSGTLWATCNVGANSPEEYGDYFAWGETSPKEYYDWNTYFDSNYDKYNIDGETTLKPEDDAAHVNWGGSWRMPTKAEQDELREKCTWSWTTQNGVKGRKVKGPNGNSIFLPAAGCRYGTSLNNAGSYGGYWSSSLYTSYSSSAYYLYFDSSYVGWYDSSRCSGQSVRAVCP